MIGQLIGTVGPGGDILTPGGVGYVVATTTPLTPGTDVRVYVHTAFTQNDIRLYGFTSPEERQVFLRLVAIQKVGPQMALSILAAVGVDGLVRAVRDGDHRPLVAADGVGAKSAERIVAMLDPTTLPAVDDDRTTSLPGAQADAVAALEGMDLDPARARDAVAAEAAVDPDADAAHLIRKALSRMVREAA